MRAAALATLLLCLASLVLGAELPEPSETPDLRTDAGDVEEIVIQGVRTGVLGADPTVFTDTVDLRDLDASQLRLEDILGQLPGVQVRRFGGAGERSELSIRGSTSAQVVVRLDGLRLDTAQSGSVDLSTLPVELFERLEVRRGGGAVEVGSGAIGGVVELQPRWPGNDATTAYRFGWGSFGSFEGSLFHGGRAGETDFSLGYAGFATRGDYRFQRPTFEIDGVRSSFEPAETERINNRAERHATVATARRELAPGLELRFVDLASFLSRGEAGLDSGAGPLAGQRRAAQSRTARNAAQLVLDYEGNRVGGSLRVSHRFERNRFSDPEPLFAAGDPIDTRTDNSALGGRAELRADLAGPWFGHAVHAGLEGRREALDASDRASRDRRVLGAWLRDEVELPGLSEMHARLVPSVRVDATQGFGTRWLPALGVVVDPLAWLRIRGHVERSFRAPNFDELFFPDQGFARGNPDLRPERATVFDLGFETLFAAVGPLQDVSLRLSGFWHEIDESIVWFLVSPDTLQPQNTGEARERGIELSVSAELGPWLRTSVNATWLEAEVTRTGVDLVGRAPLEVSARFEVGDPERLKLSVELQHVGELPVSEGGTQRISARTTVDVAAALDLMSLARVKREIAEVYGAAAGEGAHVWLAMRGRNLSDRAVRDARFFPQPGRSFTFSLEGSF